MLWITRIAASFLILSLGAAAWQTPAQDGTKVVSQQSGSGQPIALQSTEPVEAAPEQFIESRPAFPLGGYTNAGKVILRQLPDKDSPIVATLETADYEPVEILGATRDFLLIKLSAHSDAEPGNERTQDYEGWAAWDVVVPNTTAIILDADSGAVVGRVPLSEGVTSVVFSPDNTRAIFHNKQSVSSGTAYEVSTKDYTLRRALGSSGSETLGPFFYSADADELRAFGAPSGDAARTLNLATINDAETIVTRTEIASDATAFVASPDGRTGFILRPQDDQSNGMPVDVIDLGTLKVRNRIHLTVPQLNWHDAFVVNHDGSKIYLDTGSNGAAISMFDTATGQKLSEFQRGSTQDDWSYFSQGSLVGNDMLLRVWKSTGDDTAASQQSVWLGSEGRVVAEPGIDHVVEVNGTRYAVNEAGTRLFKLDDKNRIQSVHVIDRPDIKQSDETLNEMTIQSISASPDGKHIIVILGVVHGC